LVLNPPCSRHFSELARIGSFFGYESPWNPLCSIAEIWCNDVQLLTHRPIPILGEKPWETRGRSIFFKGVEAICWTNQPSSGRQRMPEPHLRHLHIQICHAALQNQTGGFLLDLTMI
jgi:hypothetical protein